jgi:bifunctional non-homologous end joining protein LigD
MLATLADAPLADPHLVYEPKYDGIRAIASVIPRVGGAEVVLGSRGGNDKTAQFPEVVSALLSWARARGAAALLDGEIVALDEHGQPLGFGHIQERIHQTQPREIARLAATSPVAYVVFDLLHDGVDDLCGLSLTERRVRLEGAMAGKLSPGGTLRLGEQARGDGSAMMEVARAHGWEGLIVKDARSIYHPGKRTRDWRKLKLLRREELVVGGYTEPRGARSWFGALLVGVPTADGRLRYAGHVGGGFSDEELARVGKLLRAREIPSSPFVTALPANERPHWVLPGFRVEVKFVEWTEDGRLRQPIYVGLKTEGRHGDEPRARDFGHEVTQRARAPIAEVATVSIPRPPTAPASAAKGAPAGARQRQRMVSTIADLEARGGGVLALPGGAAIDLGNLKKIMWPKPGFTKGDLLRYYVDVSPYLLPVVRDRPLVMRRFPDGIAGPAFYQHRAPDRVPKGVRVQRISEDDDVPSRFVGGDLATLLHMAQLAAISQDPWFSRAQSPKEMDFAAIDLDPMDDAPFSRVRDVARWVRDELDAIDVHGHLKTSGSSGLHIYLPMRPGTSFEAGMLFCQIVASMVAGKHPEAATVERTVKKRDPTAVYVDYLQNVPGKTLACAYSARASDYAGASTPLRWDELDERLDPRAFTIKTLPQRLREVGDLWAPLRKSRGVDLAAAIDRVQTKHGSHQAVKRRT